MRSNAARSPRTLTDAEKAQIAEIRNLYEARIAEAQVMHLSRLQKMLDPAGREALVLNAPDFSRIRFTRFRLRPGQDASCLNLYRPTTPTIIAPEPGFIERGRFSFAASIAGTDADERAEARDRAEHERLDVVGLL